MHFSKLACLLKSEQLKIQQENTIQSHKTHMRTVKTKEFRNMSRSSSLLQKVLVNRESNVERASLNLNQLHIIQLKKLDIEPNVKISIQDRSRKKRTSFLVPPKDFEIQSLPTLPEFSKSTKNQTKQSEVVSPHFMSALMQDKADDVKNIVRDFLLGVQQETSLENITQMYFSAQTLYDSAKEMSKKLAKTSIGVETEDTDQLELDNLQNKFTNIIRNKSRLFKAKQQHIIFEPNFGQQQERMIDQVGNRPKEGKKPQSKFDVFIPKSEITSIMNNFLNQAEKNIQVKHDNLLSNEIKQVDLFVNNMKKFKDGIKDMLYQLNHLRKMKQINQPPNQAAVAGYYPTPNKNANVLKFILKTRNLRKESAPIAQNFSEAVVQEEKVRIVNQQIDDEEYKSDLRLRLRKAFQNFFYKLKRLRLSLDDIVNQKAFPTQPFQHPGSFEFLKAVKEQEVEEVEKMLRSYRFFVYDFDNNMKTALHYAASSNDLNMIKVLMESGSDLDSRDMIGRTALHFSVKIGNIDSTRILLVYGANPSLRTIAGKQPMDFAQNLVLKALIKNAKKVFN